MATSQIAAVAIAVAGLVVALSLLIKGAAHGQPRVLGIIGSVLVLLGAVARFGFQWLLVRFLGVMDNEAIISILAAVTVAGGVLTGIGLLMLTRALVVAGWRAGGGTDPTARSR